MLRRRSSLLIYLFLLLGPTARAGGQLYPSLLQAQEPASALASMAAYEGHFVKSIELPGVADNQHLLQMLPLKTGEPLERNKVRDSIRVLYATGRFADVQAEVVPSGDEVVLTFSTSLNFFIGAVDVEGAPSRPNRNQIVNASKFQLGEPYTADNLDRALVNIRQLLQENGYFRARVTPESVSDPKTQQIDVFFHVVPGEPAHIGTVKITGHSSYSDAQIQEIARMHPGDRVTASRVTNSLQRLRKKLQKQQRVLAQVLIAEQKYQPATNAVDYTYLVEPGPMVVIYAQGFHISRSVMRKEVPVYEENALDDDLLNEGKRNLLDYLQSRGRFDAKVEVEKENGNDELRVIYHIDPGPLHHLVLIDISGNKYFPKPMLRQRLQIRVAGVFSAGSYSNVLLKSDVDNLTALYVSNGFRDVKIDTKVDDNYHGSDNRLAVHIHIDEGPQTLVGAFQITGNEKIPTPAFPELNTAVGQPYSEQNLTSDREAILNYYFNHGFSNATLDITAQPIPGEPNHEAVIYTIHEGAQFFVSRVLTGGLEHTRDYVVQREIQVTPHEPLSQQDLLDTQSKLYDLGIFSQVDTAVQNPEGLDPQKNVLVQVQEAKRYTFTYDGGLEFETGLPVGTAPAGTTGVSPRVGFDVSRLNVGGRDQTLTFDSHVGRIQQRGLISYEMPKPFNNDQLKVFYTLFYDNSRNVATFTSERLEGKIDLREQIGKLRPNHSTSITYRFDYRQVKATNFQATFSPAEISLFSLPARVGGPGFTFINDHRDNPLESTKGQYFTLDGSTAIGFFGSQADFGRLLGQDSTYYAFGPAAHKFVFARSTTLGLEQAYGGTRVLPPGACTVSNLATSCATNITVIPLPEEFFAGGGNSHRGFGLNQAGPRDPDSGFPIGGSALFVNSEEIRLPQVSLPYLGEGFGFAIFHDMGNVYTAEHDMLKGVLRWHQPDPAQCLQNGGVAITSCFHYFNNSGYDFTSHAAGVGLRYKTPIGPLRFDFGYNLNPTRYFESVTCPPNVTGIPCFEAQRLRPFNVFFSIGQPF